MKKKRQKRHAQAFESDRKLAGNITSLPRPILEESSVYRRKFEENPVTTDALEVFEDITNILETREAPLFTHKPSKPIVYWKKLAGKTTKVSRNCR